MLLFLILALLNVMDLSLTIYGLDLGFIEVNPLLSNESVELLILVKILALLILLAVSLELDYTKLTLKSRNINIGFYLIGIIVYIVVVIHNYLVLI